MYQFQTISNDFNNLSSVHFVRHKAQNKTKRNDPICFLLYFQILRSIRRGCPSCFSRRKTSHVSGRTLDDDILRFPTVFPPITNSILRPRIGRGESPLLVQSPAVPLVSEFRQAVLSRFKIPHEHHRDCSHLNILFIWRRNYVAHPRNPSGVVSRKIKNEDELLNATRSAFKNNTYNITGVQLDSLGVSAQLELLSKTDIMIGMHGAAFGFSLLLPQGGGIIELYPKGSAKNWHMEYLAKWNKLHHSTWTNKNGRLEDIVNKYTTVPPDIVLTLLNKMIQNICQ